MPFKIVHINYIFLGLLSENKKSGTAFVIEALYALHAFTPSINLVSVIVKVGIFLTAQKFLRATQIDSELHILCRAAR